MQETSELYEIRFSKDERQLKERVWKPLCEEFFQKFVASDDTVLDIACGYGEFTRFIHAGSKVAIDLNTRSAASLPAGVQFHLCSADSMAPVNTSSIDVAFASNFFEHLPSKDSMDKVLKEIFRVLKPDGRLIMMQPNIKYCAESYWDFYDHHLPLSHLSAAEGLQLNGFKLERVIPRFVPFSTKSAYPKSELLVRLYLKMPIFWPLFGKQFVIVARKEV